MIDEDLLRDAAHLLKKTGICKVLYIGKFNDIIVFKFLRTESGCCIPFVTTESRLCKDFD
jgi:hypothetical protein